MALDPAVAWEGRALLVAALAIGLVPGLAAQAEEAADRFTDRPAYAAAVLQLAGAGERGTTTSHGPTHVAWPAFWAVVSALLGLGLALVALRPDRVPAGPRERVVDAWAPVAAALRGLHNGHLADSVTWLVVGMAGFGGLLALVLR
jgi:hypothetical protein